MPDLAVRDGAAFSKSSRGGYRQGQKQENELNFGHRDRLLFHHSFIQLMMSSSADVRNRCLTLVEDAMYLLVEPI
jgi:hypothetical protein